MSVFRKYEMSGRLTPAKGGEAGGVPDIERGTQIQRDM